MDVSVSKDASEARRLKPNITYTVPFVLTVLGGQHIPGVRTVVVYTSRAALRIITSHLHPPSDTIAPVRFSFYVTRPNLPFDPFSACSHDRFT